MYRDATPKRLLALTVFAGLPLGSPAAEFGYSYLDLMADVSETGNTAADPLEEDADGRLHGIAVSWEVSDSIYVKGAWSRETKEFGNEVANTPVDLDSEQKMLVLGAGYHFDAGEQTSIYAEALAIVDFEVEHRIPIVVPSRSGPPSVSTADSTIDGNGFSAAAGCVTGSAKCWSSKASSHAPLPARMSFVPAERSRTPRPCSVLARTFIRVNGCPLAPFSPSASIRTTTSTTSGSSASRFASISDQGVCHGSRR